MANSSDDLVYHVSDYVELRENNPYSVGQILKYYDGQISLEREPMVYEKNINDRYFTTIDGDTLWNIAFEAYGDSKEWWRIADVNGIYNPFDLPAGTSLLIPDLPTSKVYNP